MNRHLSALVRDGEVEPIGDQRGSRGCRWRITPQGLHAATRLWGEDLPPHVLVGGARISTSDLLSLWRVAFGNDETPDALVALVLGRGWLPFIHSTRQNPHVFREDYNPFGFLTQATDPEVLEAAVSLSALACRATSLRPSGLGRDIEGAVAVVSPLLLLVPNKRVILHSISVQAIELGLDTDIVRAVLRAIGGAETPDREVRTAAFETLLRLDKRMGGMK